MKRKLIDGKRILGLFVKGDDESYYCSREATKILFDAINGPRKRQNHSDDYLAYLIDQGLVIQGEDGNYYNTPKATEILKKAIQ